MDNTKRSFEQIRIALETQRDGILTEAGVGTVNEGAFPDVGDQASAEADQNFSLRLKEREQKLLKKINKTLKRIADDDYGICEECEEEISMPRLTARPVATFCIDCKTAQEHQEKTNR